MKAIKFLALALALALCMCIFTACGDSTDVEVEVPEGSVSYTLEAEDTNLLDYAGTMYSGNTSGYDAVSGADTSNVTSTAIDSVSGGYFVAYFNTVGETITYNFTADKASTGNSLYITMGSEYGTLTVSPENISITVNGTALDYDSFKVKGTYTSEMGGTFDTAFTTAQLPDIDLLEGDNTIEVKVIKVDYSSSQSSLTESVPHGPANDCITVVTTSELDWDDQVYEDYM